MVPGDLVLLSSSVPMELAYVMTANLDGETQSQTEKKTNPDILEDAELKAVRGTVQCEPPNKNIEAFEGNIALSGSRLQFLRHDQHAPERHTEAAKYRVGHRRCCVPGKGRPRFR